MKASRLIVLAGVLAAGLSAGVARSEELKVGYVDTARIFEQYKVAQDAQKQFDRDVVSWNKDLADLKNDIANLRKELENQSLVLSDALRREKEATLSRKQSEYQSQVDHIWGPKGRATQRNEELVKSVVDKIRKVLDTMAQKEGYTLVLDGASGRILYALMSYDLTQKVIDQLNQEASDASTIKPAAQH